MKFPNDEDRDNPKFLTKEDRENLFVEYEQLNAEVRERNQRIWLIDTILLTGSLIVAFQSGRNSPLMPVVAFVLVFLALAQHYTGRKVNAVSHEAIGEIRNDLGLTKTENMYKSKLKGKLWFSFRAKVPYGIFIFLMAVYVFLIFNNLGLEITISTVT